VVQSLVRLGYVRSIRGIGGGVELKRKPAEIRIGELIVAFEGNLSLLECVSTEGLCVIQPTCRLRTVLATAERLQLDYLNSVCLADLLVPGQTLVRIESSPEPTASG
jgi:Rrf2 family nitric oxide-sensitive transcriptional repressor